MKLKFTLLLILLSITGCATIVDGKTQTMTVSTRGDVDKRNTECEIKNSNGVWVTDNKESLVIRRDNDDLIINCENEKQDGSVVIESSASGGFMAANFFIWDLCTISCIVDHNTGALYEYPMHVSIPMKNKETHKTAEINFVEKTTYKEI